MSDPAKQRATSTGCLWGILLAPVAIVLGLVIGTIASRDGDDLPTEETVTLARGTADGQGWRVDAERDVEGDVCAFFYLDGEQLTGACEAVPHRGIASDTVTVVFGKAPGGAQRVRVSLTDGRELELDTRAAGDIEGRFYVEEVAGDPDLDVTGELEVIAP